MAAITQRTSGLVQRRTEATRSAAADKDRESGGEEDEARRAEEEDDDKGDSKETRLTLMEEVLLLGLKDREVSAVVTPLTGRFTDVGRQPCLRCVAGRVCKRQQS